MKLSVLQWNIWYQQDIHDVATLLVGHKPDVVCLQELTLHYPRQSESNTPEYLASQLGYYLYYQSYPLQGGVLGANAILSRLPITQPHFAWTATPDGSGSDADEHRLYVEVTVVTDNGLLHIGTTHMHYTHRFRGNADKRQETTNLVQQLSRHKNRLIFTGDLNAKPNSQTLKSIRKIMRHVGPDYDQKTWATKPFSYNGFTTNDLNWRLDYIFASRDIRPLASKIIQTEFSDHLPVLATVQV